MGSSKVSINRTSLAVVFFWEWLQIIQIYLRQFAVLLKVVSIESIDLRKESNFTNYNIIV